MRSPPESVYFPQALFGYTPSTEYIQPLPDPQSNSANPFMELT